MERAKVYLALGSNLGDRKNNLKKALRSLLRNGIQISKVSSVYETEPVGFRKQNKFLNMTLVAHTNLQPKALMKKCKEIERQLGRIKTVRFGPRVIDIDILIYGHTITSSKDLTLPHPRLTLRNFVLVPLAEIAPGLRHPVNGKTIKYLLSHSADTAMVERYCKPLTY